MGELVLNYKQYNIIELKFLYYKQRNQNTKTSYIDSFLFLALNKVC